MHSQFHAHRIVMTSDLKHFESKIYRGRVGVGEDAWLADQIGSEQARISCHLVATDGIATHVHVSVVYRGTQCTLDGGSTVGCFRQHILQQTKDKNSFIAAVTDTCRTAVWCQGQVQTGVVLCSPGSYPGRCTTPVVSEIYRDFADFSNHMLMHDPKWT